MPNTNDSIKPIDKLPSELWSYILNKLDPRDLKVNNLIIQPLLFYVEADVQLKISL